MGRAVDLFVTYRFIKLLTTPFEKTDAFKLGIIDKDGNRIRKPNSSQVEVELTTSQLKNSYTILHKLVFNIKKIFSECKNEKSLKDAWHENSTKINKLSQTFVISVQDHYKSCLSKINITIFLRHWQKMFLMSYSKIKE